MAAPVFDLFGDDPASAPKASFDLFADNPAPNTTGSSASTPKPAFDLFADAPIEKPSIARRAGDVALEAVAGATGGIKAVSDAFGAGSRVSQVADEATRELQSYQSPARQLERQRHAQRTQEAEASGSALREAGAAVRNFVEAPVSSIASAFGSSAPTLVATAANPALGVTVGAMQGAGAVKGAVHDDVRRRHIEAGMDPVEAGKLAREAQAYGGPNTDQIALGGALGAVAGRFGAEGVLAGTASKGGGVLTRAARAAAIEGGTEAVQGGQERLAANIGSQRAGFEDVPTWQGVAGQATFEGLAGAGVGAGMSLAAGRPNVATDPQSEVAGPLPAPVNTGTPAEQILQFDVERTNAVDNAEARAADLYRRRAEVDAQRQPPAVPPSVQMGLDPNAGPLSSAAAAAVDNGVSPASPGTNTGTQAAAGPTPLAPEAGTGFDVSGRTDAQLQYLSTNGQPGWKEAAQAELVRRTAATGTAQPDTQPANPPVIDRAPPPADQFDFGAPRDFGEFAPLVPNQSPIPLENAQRLVDLLRNQGADFAVVPATDGQGFGFAPIESLTLAQREAVSPFQPTTPADDGPVWSNTDPDIAPVRLLPMTEAGARRRADEMTRRRGIEHTVIPHPKHEDRFAVVPADTINAAQAQSTTPAVPEAAHIEPGQPIAPATSSEVQKAIATGNRNSQADARTFLLDRIEQAKANTPDRSLSARYAELMSQAKEARRIAGLKKTRPDIQQEMKDLADRLENRTIPELRQQIGYITFEVPGDGKFRVLNTPENLDRFTDKVRRSKAFRGLKVPGDQTGQAAPADMAAPSASAGFAPDTTPDIPSATARADVGAAPVPDVQIVRMSPPAKSAEAAERIAVRNRERTGLDWRVMPHPRMEDRYVAALVAPAEQSQAATAPQSHSVDNRSIPADNQQQADHYDTIETRPGTTEAQKDAGRSALSALVRRLNAHAVRGRGDAADRGPVTILGSRLAAGFRESGGNRLIGQTVESAADLATLARVYRDPRFETFRVFYTQNDTVVGEAGYSNRLPAAVYISPELGQDIRRDLEGFGADGYFILHNHPSGRSKPSASDVNITRSIARSVPGMRAHVVIDNNEYSVITPGGSETTIPAPELASVDFTASPEIDHELLGIRISGNRDLALIGKVLKTSEDHGTVIFTRRDGTVQLIADVPLAHFRKQSKTELTRLQAVIRRFARASGSGGFRFLVLPEGMDAREFSGMLRKGIFRDVVSADGKALSEETFPGRDFLDGRTRDAFRTAEPESEFDIAARYTLPDGSMAPGWLRAPNGEPTSLTERQWIATRTESFRQFFGDFEIAAQVLRPARNFTEARTAATTFQGRELTNGRTGMTATVSRNNLDKMLSNSAVSKSTSAADQSLAVANLDHLFENAEYGWTKPDRDSNTNIVGVHRFFAPMDTESGTRVVKLTVKESAHPNQGSKIYTVESLEIDSPASIWVDANIRADGLDSISTPYAGPIRSLVQRAQDFNAAKASKAVTPNGEPAVLYRAGQIGPFQRFTPDPAAGGEAVFLNVRNPQKISPDARTESRARLLEWAQRRGHDGGTIGSDFVAFSDAQVRPADDAVNEPASAYDSTPASEPDKLGMRDWITHQMKNARGWAMGALTRDQIADLFGKEMPQVRRFDEVVQNMDATRQTISQEADVLVERWRQLPGPVADRLADLMHRATIGQFDPDTAESTKNATEAEIQQLWDTLPDTAKDLYREVRDSYARTLGSIRDGLADRAERASSTGAQVAAKIRLEFDKHLAKGPYFPLARFGDLMLIAKKGGETRVETFESSFRREQRKRMLAANGWTVKQTRRQEYSASRDGSASEFVSKVIEKIDSTNMPADQKANLLDGLNQMAIGLLPSASYRQHFAHRKGTPGFSTDAMRAFASSMQHAAHHIARIRHAHELSILLDEMQKGIREAHGAVDVTLQQEVVTELGRRLDLLMNPNVHPVAAAAGQVGFVMSLGGSVAAGLVNLTQTPMVTLPWLGAKHGFPKAAAALTKASKDYFSGKWEKWSGFVLTSSPNLTADEKAAIQQLEASGLISLTQSSDLAGTANTDSTVSSRAWAINRAMKVVGWTFHVPEVFNRQVSALASYRLAREAGKDHAAAVEEARITLIRTHFDYSASNRARFMQGNFRRVIFMFKQYSQQTTYLLWRNAHQALKGESPEVKREARRMLVGVGAMHFAAAGSLGLPLGVFGISPLLSLLAMGMGDEDDPYDWETEYRNMLADTFGQDMGEAIAKGPLRMLLNVDFASRVGLGDLWIRPPSKEAEGRDLVEAWMLTLLGPVAGYIGQVGTAAKAFDEGKYARGVESMVPKFIASPLKAARFEQEGVRSWRGDDLGIDLTPADIFGVALGFQPSRMAEMYEGRAAVKGREARLQGRRQEILNMWVAANMAGDRSGQMEAVQAAHRFSKKNPAFAITGDAFRQAYRSKMRNAAQIRNGIHLSRKRDSLRDEGRFANVQ